MTFWQTERVRLRQMQSDDGDFGYRINQDAAMNHLIDYVPLPTTPENRRRWAEKNATQEREGDKFAFVILARNLPNEPRVGFLYVHTADRRNGTLMYGLGVLSDFRRRGYASDAIRLVLHYYFTELRYQKCNVEIHADNFGSLHLHENLGFIKEGCIRRMVYTGGKLLDEMAYGITAEEFLAK